jgi:prophage antirepressor-like protein
MSSSDSSTHSLLPLYYHGHQIRMDIDEHGLLWWVAQDLGDHLGIVNVRTSVANFPDDEKGVRSAYTPGGEQTVLMVNEPGLYRLIFQSRKEEAERLKRWVFHDVLPTLRRTGTYTVPQPQPQPQDQLTQHGHLPAPAPRVKEHAEVSWHLAAVWSLLQRSGECLTNYEIAQRTGIARRTASAHTRYLLQLGMLEVHETFPRHLYVFSASAEQRNASVYHRLQRLTEVIQARHAL